MNPNDHNAHEKYIWEKVRELENKKLNTYIAGLWNYYVSLLQMNAMDSGIDVFPKEEAKVVEQERLKWKSLQWKQKLMSMMEEDEV